MKKFFKIIVCGFIAMSCCDGDLTSFIMVFLFAWFFVRIIKGIFSLAFSGARGLTRATGRMSDNIGMSVGQTIMGNSAADRRADDAYRARQKAANDAAIRRYDAINQMKKNEYDARDAALRGKDIAARQYQNQADYYYRESRR